VLARPEKHNAFDDALIAQMTQAFKQAGDNPQVRVIILRAEGKHFSAGADLAWMRRMADMDWQQNHTDASQLAALMQAIDEAPCPVICRVQGAAYGGALGLICASDIALASNSARFCLSEVKLGILPAVISPYVARAMGPRQAGRYFVSGEVFNAETAQAIGVVHEAVDESALDKRIDEITDALLAGAPGAQREARALVQHVCEQPLDAGLRDWSAQLIARLRTSDEGKEGLDAFLHKRAPSWKTDSDDT
jgi:methylglutaconyl-CoA hydratase